MMAAVFQDSYDNESANKFYNILNLWLDSGKELR